MFSVSSFDQDQFWIGLIKLLKFVFCVFWKRTPNDKRQKVIAIELIFMDEQGRKIQGTIFSKLFYKFEKHLREDDCYYINKPEITENNLTYGVIKHPYKILLKFDSSISKCNIFHGPKHCFEFSSFKTIKADKSFIHRPCDVIGYVVQLLDVEFVTTKFGIVTKKLKLYLEDLEDEVISVTLWGDYADQITAYVSNNYEVVHVVLVLQFAKYYNFNEDKYMGNNYDATRLFINDENIEEIGTFKKSWIAMKGEKSNSSQRSLGSSVISATEDDFIHKTLFTSIKHIKSHLKDHVKSMVVVGSITSIFVDIFWCYDGCDFCKHKVNKTTLAIEKDDGSGDFEFKDVCECINRYCDHELVTSTKMFKIPVKVNDGTGYVVLTLFDKEEEKLLGVSAKEVYNNFLDFEDIPDVKRILPEFNPLVSKKYAFKIEIKPYNHRNQESEFFGVSKLTVDDDIIQALDNKLKDYQFEQFASTNSSIFVEGSQNSFETKDSDTYPMDYETPISKCDETSGKSITGETKRNISEAYDDEDYFDHSSTKSTSSESKKRCFEPNEGKLLIPKMEK